MTHGKARKTTFEGSFQVRLLTLQQNLDYQE